MFLKPCLRLFRIMCLSALCFAMAANANPSLTEEILAADKQFFSAFNQCDIETMSSVLSEELEFYHDIVGLSDYASTMAVTKANCERKLGLRRTLIMDSLEIYPVKNFGAIQVGEHQFCHTVDGTDDCGTFAFTHIWKRTDSRWEIFRVVSYDH